MKDAQSAIVEDTLLSMSSMQERYNELLHQIVFASNSLDIESALTIAADLGRELVRCDTPPEEVTTFHHNALIKLAQFAPELTLGQTAQFLTAPLTEVLMAYSLGFRERLEHRAATMVNARLEQSRRLEALGTLAAGIAHDFNNLLGAITGFTELLGDDLTPDAPGQRHIALILLVCFRARDLIAHLLTFARELNHPPAPLDILPPIKATLELLRATLPVGIELNFICDLSHAWVMADASQIQQILMNLCVNAADALPTGHGRIQIQLDLDYNLNLTNPMLHLRVRDNGEGMSQDLQQRVFDPFFTTKAPGKGSGLGLSVIHGLVSKLGGVIDLISSPGAGSEFHIRLPCLELNSNSIKVNS